jgi:hypothetical protein
VPAENRERSYHDLHITTVDIPRTSIFDLPYNMEITCNRAAGWGLWDSSASDSSRWKMLAGEYDPKWLRLDVAGYVIVDSEGKVSDAE